MLFLTRTAYMSVLFYVKGGTLTSKTICILPTLFQVECLYNRCFLTVLLYMSRVLSMRIFILVIVQKSYSFPINTTLLVSTLCIPISPLLQLHLDGLAILVEYNPYVRLTHTPYYKFIPRNVNT
jgi:hypothetical protein